MLFLVIHARANKIIKNRITFTPNLFLSSNVGSADHARKVVISSACCSIVALVSSSYSMPSSYSGAFLEYLEGKNLPGINALN